jgi:F0F1-type ATP synthase membrane subunit b/b'
MMIAIYIFGGLFIGASLGIILLKLQQKQIMKAAQEKGALVLKDARRKADDITKDAERKSRDTVEQKWKRLDARNKKQKTSSET